MLICLVYLARGTQPRKGKTGKTNRKIEEPSGQPLHGRVSLLINQTARKLTRNALLFRRKVSGLNSSIISNKLNHFPSWNLLAAAFVQCYVLFSSSVFPHCSF